MSIRVKKFQAKNMSVAEKLGKELLRLYIQGGYDRDFLECSFIPYNGTDKREGVTIFAMQGSPIRGFVVIDPLARMVKVFDSFFDEINRIGIDYSDVRMNSYTFARLGYCPKIRTYNPDFKEIPL